MNDLEKDRIDNFEVKIEKDKPLKSDLHNADNERNIRITHNGYQWIRLMLNTKEMKILRDALEAELNLQTKNLDNLSTQLMRGDEGGID